MPKPNYGHVKRQKEAARKARAQEKLNRRLAPRGPGSADEPAEVAPVEAPAEKATA
jgi:hypothetical protein